MTSSSRTAAHTAGPWMAASAPSSVVGWPVVGPTGHSICTVTWMPKKAYPDASDADYAAFNAECKATAFLIAAAPQLLKALTAIVQMDDDAIAANGKPNANLNGYGLVDLFDCVGHHLGSGVHKQQPSRSNNLEAALIDARAAITAAKGGAA